MAPSVFRLLDLHQLSHFECCWLARARPGAHLPAVKGSACFISEVGTRERPIHLTSIDYEILALQIHHYLLVLGLMSMLLNTSSISDAQASPSVCPLASEQDILLARPFPFCPISST
ncbi:hypothetical protein N7G274_001251 [Stereocaulon virgatum]|uniref:Uncharacterized protein n=1 Tax=Stereocaulon virgatum TaxID=373712 RepID=A0ABR4ANB4_9LECA